MKHGVTFKDSCPDEFGMHPTYCHVSDNEFDIDDWISKVGHLFTEVKKCRIEYDGY